MTKKTKTTTKVKLIFPRGHLGATPSDHPLELVIRALSLKHGKPDEWADKYGTVYEDGVIRIHPDYQHFDCSCGYEPHEKAWLEANPHTADCFVTVAGGIVAEIERTHSVPDFEVTRTMDGYDIAGFMQFWHGGLGPTEQQTQEHEAAEAERKVKRQVWATASKARSAAIRKAIADECQRSGVKLDHDPEWSWEYHCTCGRASRRADWEKQHQHTKPCEYWWAGQPNFLHKPSGLAVSWYKYIGRDMKVEPNPIPRPAWKQLIALVADEDVRRVIDNARANSLVFSRTIEHANKQMAQRTGRE